MGKIGLRSLIVSAAIALVLLTVFSDLVPAHVDGFGDVAVGKDVSVECVVVQCNHSKSGLIMTALDRNGLEASIFLSPSVLAAQVPVGTVVRVTVVPSGDDPTFMFGSKIEVLS